MGSEHDDVSPAEQAFVEFLEARETGEASFDEFCDARPRLAAELRRIHGAWQWAGDLLGPGGDDGDDLASDAGERYQILGELAQGGMGAVLRAYDRTLRRTVAMKVLRPEASVRRRSVARFRDEAQITGQLEHPSVVPIYDAGTLPEGRIFYTMPLVRGRELTELFQLAREGREGWSTTRAVGVLLRVCEAVGAAHARGVIHRDLKPANVMVGAHGEVYVMDWGVARVVAERPGVPTAEDEAAVVRSERQERIRAGEDTSLGTLDGQVLGTPSYMSPEQARGEWDAVGRAADVYSAGAMLRLLLVGVRPYAESAESASVEDVLQRLVAGPPPPLRRLAPDAAPELVAICERAMARDPHDRYAEMAELAADLRAFLERRVVSAYRTGAVTELVQWFRRNPALSAALCAAVVSLAVGLVVSLSLKRRSDEHAERADQNLESALAAVDRMLSEVGFRELEDVPGLQPVRRRLLEEARSFYEGFLATHADDAEVQTRVARAHSQLALVYRVLGEFDAALAAEEKNVELVEDLAEEESSFQRRLSVVDALAAQGKSFLQAHELERSRETLEDALQRLAPLVEEQPANPVLSTRRADILGSIGQLLVIQRDPEAESWLVRSIDLGQETLDAVGGDDLGTSGGGQLSEVLAHSLDLYGVFHMQAQRFEEARSCHERAVELREACYRANPGRVTKSRLRASLGNLNAAVGSVDPSSEESNRIARRTLELCRELAADYPEAPKYSLDLLRSLTAYALGHTGHDFEGALEPLEEALDLWAGFPAEVRGHPLAASVMEGVHYTHSWVMTSLARYEELAELITTMRPVDPQSPVPDLRIGAQAFAFCLDALVQDTELAGDERAALQEEYVVELSRRLEELRDLGHRAEVLARNDFRRILDEYPELDELLPR